MTRGEEASIQAGTTESASQRSRLSLPLVSYAARSEHATTYEYIHTHHQGVVLENGIGLSRRCIGKYSAKNEAICSKVQAESKSPTAVRFRYSHVNRRRKDTSSSPWTDLTKRCL